MAKSTSSIFPKPPLIISIEKHYRIILGRVDFSTQTMNSSTYAIDKEGQVIGLTIREENIIDIELLGAFNDLQYLSLTHNKIQDISPLSQMTKLKTLFIGGNNVKSIKPLVNCIMLVKLAVWGNPINDLSILRSLVNLKELYFSRTNTEDISFISELKSLSNIGAQGNKIQDVSPIVNLSKLVIASFESNRINNINCLKNVRRNLKIDVSNNSIKIISKQVAERFNLLDHSLEYPYKSSHKNLITLIENPLEYPPASVIELGKETISDYYENSENFGHKSLSEGRIIVVGDGSAGKTSLIERILYNSFDQGKNQTNGIKIEHWKLSHSDGRPLIFHIWDFGGQEIQHAVHKFFFTEGCLYLLVLDNRKEEDPEYWLQQIESLGGSASVLVVFNKHDENAAEVADRKFLKDKYPNIIGFFNTSCKTGYGIDKFTASLIKNATDLRTVDEQFPNNWFDIKKSIEEYTSGEKYYLNFETYRAICQQYAAQSNKTQKLLLKYFTTIGAVTWFGDTFLNFLHVLSPAWITQGVYKIITSKKLHIFLAKFTFLTLKNCCSQSMSKITLMMKVTMVIF